MSYSSLLGANYYGAFRAAAQDGNTEILNYLLKAAERLDVQRAMLEAGNYEAFIHAARDGNTKILDSLLKAAERSGVQRAMLEAGDYIVFIYAARNGNTEILSYLLNAAERSDVQRAMLKARNYEAFRAAAKNGHTKVLEYLLTKAESPDVQRAMLGANNYEAFRAAAKNGHTKVLDFLWDAAGQLGVRSEMLSANNYEALYYVIRNSETASLLREFVPFVDGNLVSNSHFIQQISIEEWKKYLEAIANSNDRGTLNWMWENLVPSGITQEQEVNELYQRLEQEFAEARNSSEPYQEEGEHRNRRSINGKVTNSATRSSSLINDFVNWVKDSIDGLFNSRDALPVESGKTPSSGISKVDAQVDVHGMMMLIDLLIRRFITGQKHTSKVDQPMSPLEAQSDALNITEEFEQALKSVAIKSGISVTNLEFKPVKVCLKIVGQIRNGEFSAISKTLYSSAEEACPKCMQSDKFLAHVRSHLEEVLAEKETVRPQREVKQTLDKPTSRVSRSKILKKLKDIEKILDKSIQNKSVIKSSVYDNVFEGIRKNLELIKKNHSEKEKILKSLIGAYIIIRDDCWDSFKHSLSNNEPLSGKYDIKAAYENLSTVVEVLKLLYDNNLCRTVIAGDENISLDEIVSLQRKMQQQQPPQSATNQEDVTRELHTIVEQKNISNYGLVLPSGNNVGVNEPASSLSGVSIMGSRVTQVG